RRRATRSTRSPRTAAATGGGPATPAAGCAGRPQPNQTQEFRHAGLASPRLPPLAAPGGPNRSQTASAAAQDDPPAAARRLGRAGPRGVAMLQHRAVLPTPYPMDTVEHRKRPGGVYEEGSPLHRKQRALHVEAEATRARAGRVEEVPAPPPPAEEERPRHWRPPTTCRTRCGGPATPGEDHGLLRGRSRSLCSPACRCGRRSARLGLGVPAVRRSGVHRGLAVQVLRESAVLTDHDAVTGRRLRLPAVRRAGHRPGPDWPICLMAFCCPAIRWADTMSMAPLLPFWAALGLMLLLDPPASSPPRAA
ncbi:unnamed protein product, partial [Prorocentrum cordatum]